jgi:hypothetical protein
MTTNEAMVLGAGVISIIEGMGAFKSKAKKILSDHGLPEELQADQWYSLEAASKALHTISDKIGPSTLLQIGRKVPELAVFPPGIDSIDKALHAISVGYGMNHRGSGIGSYTVVQLSDKEYAVDCDAFYPCEFDKGFIESMVKKYKLSNLYATVKHNDTDPCRKRGDKHCRYRIS